MLHPWPGRVALAMVKSPSPSKATTGKPPDRVAELRSLLLSGQRLRRAIADRHRLSLSEMVVLGHLADSEGALGPGELAERMLVGSGTLTAVVDRLVRGGYVERGPHVRDRRRVLVALTPAGRQVVRQVERHMRRALDHAAAQADPPPLALLVACLDSEIDRIRRAAVAGGTPVRRNRA